MRKAITEDIVEKAEDEAAVRGAVNGMFDHDLHLGSWMEYAVTLFKSKLLKMKKNVQ